MGIELLFPLGLLAMIAVPIVILFHMRHVTPTPRPMPTLRFWREAAPERSDARRFHRPPLTLLLLLQLLVVGLLAVGLGRPATAESWSWLGLDLRAEREHVIVILDGSTSMSAVDSPDGQSRWQLAQRAVLDEIAPLREGDAATLLVVGTRIHTYEATDAASFATLREQIESLPLPGGQADINAALDLASKLRLPNLTDRLVVVSDGAIAVDPSLVANLPVAVTFRSVAGNMAGLAGGNVAVTQISSRPDPRAADHALVYTRITNFSSQAVTVPVILLTDEIEASRQDVNLPENGGGAELQWRLPAGITRADVVVEVADAFPADDRASFILRQQADLGLDVLLVSDLPGATLRALQVLPGASVTTIGSGELAQINPAVTYDLVVYEKVAPPPTLPNSAILLVNPPINGGPFPVRGQMAAPTVTNVVADHPVLRGVDTAGLTFGPTPAFEMSGDQTSILDGEAGPLIIVGTLQTHPMVALTFDVEASNLPQRVAFPILIANIASYLVPTTLPSTVGLGDPVSYQPSNGAARVSLTMPDGTVAEMSVTTRPEAAGSFAGSRLAAVSFADTGQAGVYRLSEQTADGTELSVGQFVVNAGHPTESDLRVTPGLADIFATATSSDEDSVIAGLADLWPVLVVLALLILVLEWLIAVLPWRPGSWRSRGRRSLPLGTEGRP